jgi:hypothetical protein
MVSICIIANIIIFVFMSKKLESYVLSNLIEENQYEDSK